MRLTFVIGYTVYWECVARAFTVSYVRERVLTFTHALFHSPHTLFHLSFSRVFAAPSYAASLCRGYKIYARTETL